MIFSLWKAVCAEDGASNEWCLQASVTVCYFLLIVSLGTLRSKSTATHQSTHWHSLLLHGACQHSRAIGECIYLLFIKNVDMVLCWWYCVLVISLSHVIQSLKNSTIVQQQVYYTLDCVSTLYSIVQPELPPVLVVLPPSLSLSSSSSPCDTSRQR